MNINNKMLYNDPNLVFKESSFNGIIRLTPDAALTLCDLAIENDCYIDWYECGIWYGDKQGYEGHDVWGKILSEIKSNSAIHENNLEAKENIRCDIEDGYNVFELCIKHL
ncbi:hypothetical protein [Acinetobacter nosocomialis]|uniref:hypothetical protein n=1 Tax=Acinetobacter nosocomialis TaxID=106654 RepID=UPI001FD6D0F7|nr:hypothetical protein [Acinetobacter nosocomialis]